VKVCISGGSSLLGETRRRFQALTGARIVDAYSLTEAMNAAVVAPVTGLHKDGAVGLPLPDVELRVIALEPPFADLPAGCPGQVLMRAPQLMSGYCQRPDDTARAIRDGWLQTGDIGYLDEDGFLFLVDRLKDVIKPGGQQVWPREVEEAMATHPAVAEVAVAGVRDQDGEAVKAWVVLGPGRSAAPDDLRAHCRQQLAGFKVPRHIEYCAALPRSHAGKVLRRALQDRDPVASPPRGVAAPSRSLA
jgi:long-chain acyl-CoA synthetase